MKKLKIKNNKVSISPPKSEYVTGVRHALAPNHYRAHKNKNRYRL